MGRGGRMAPLNRTKGCSPGVLFARRSGVTFGSRLTQDFTADRRVVAAIPPRDTGHNLYTRGYSMRGEWRRQIEARAREIMKNDIPWAEAYRRADSEFGCGARARSAGGRPCQARPMSGSRRCRHHGGFKSDEGRERLRQAAPARWQPGGVWFPRRRTQRRHRDERSF